MTYMLLLLSRFSRVRLCATPQTAAHRAPPSLGFSRQEHWSWLPFPSPMHESEKWKCSRSVVSDSLQPHGLQPTRLLRPWDFPGKSTGVGVPLPSLTCMLMSLKPLLFHPINFQMVSYRCLQCDAEQDSPSCHSFLLLFKDFLVQEASFPSATLIRHSGLILNISLSHASHIWPVTLLKVPL